MSDMQIVLLALVQGITEFLPISSSGHLILVPVVTGWPDQGLLIDIAVHVGSLGAVLVYWRHDLAAMLRGLGESVRAGLMAHPGRRLLVQIAIATVPVLAAGLALSTTSSDLLRSLAVIGWASIGFGILLYMVDLRAPGRRGVEEIGIGDALVIGLAQALALIPGTSRAGITITAGRWLGLRRDEAARFSMLLSIPTILGAGALLGLDLIRLGQSAPGADALLAAALAFGSALAAITLMMRWLRHATYTPFVVYRCALGIILLAYVYA